MPDQAVGQRYYEDFGLVDVTGGEQGGAPRPARQDRDTVLLYEGPRKRLHHLCYGATGRGLRAGARRRSARAGVSEIDPPRGAPEGGIWFRDPDGNLVNVRDEAAPAIPPVDPPLTLNGPGYTPRQARAARRSAASAPHRDGSATCCSSPPTSTRQMRLLHPGARA